MTLIEYKFPPRIEIRTVRNGEKVKKKEYESDEFFLSYPSKTEIDKFRKSIQSRKDLKDNIVYVIEVSENGISLIEEPM